MIESMNELFKVLCVCAQVHAHSPSTCKLTVLLARHKLNEARLSFLKYCLIFQTTITLNVRFSTKYEELILKSFKILSFLQEMKESRGTKNI